MSAPPPPAAAAIAARYHGPAPRVALILGSGLGALADAVAAPTVIAYDDLPGFPRPTVEGHGGRLVLGRIGRSDVAVLAGRGHFYEHGRADIMAPAIDTIAALGCRTLILTNAAGSLRPAIGPGAAVLISDHINLALPGPLVGSTGNDRFVDLVDAYDPGLRRRLGATARRLGLDLPEGVYMLFPGPNFETPAEIRAARLLGADLVGMSTVPEVVLARRRGLTVAALSVVTNLGAGMVAGGLSHADTLSRSATGAALVQRLLTALLDEETPL
ncbi:MAG: purine-nucleoside phosphorylase [Azospirillaceae bacterium]|nr:purine-nucleoside phosphorylase [Azospirillaceae bacterium]